MYPSRVLVCLCLMSLSSAALAVPVTLIDEDFNAGLPTGWTVDSSGTVSWGISGDAGNEANNWTGGTGSAASASSDAASAGAYDASLITTSFSLENFSSASLDFLVNYQALGSAPTSDNFDVDVSLDGGANWLTALAFDDDAPVGGLFVEDGVAVNLDLAAYLGESDVTLRFHYYNPDPDAFDWYAQIDDVLVAGDFMSPGSVAEPPSLAIMAFGLIGLGLWRRRDFKGNLPAGAAPQ